jgi:hypothetical protein
LAFFGVFWSKIWHFSGTAIWARCNRKKQRD